MTCDLQSLNWELADLKPPIPRDRLIFEEVLVKGRGQLEVAQEQGISQPRVSKILVSAANPVMSKSAKTEELSPIASSQTQAEPAVANDELNTLKAREAMIKSIIKIARRDPKRADWTEAELRHAAEITLAKLDAANQENEARRRIKAEAKAAKAAARAAQESTAPAVPPIPDAESIVEAEEPHVSSRQHEQASISLNAARLEKLRREHEKRRSPRERRREFLVPLAAG